MQSVTVLKSEELPMRFSRRSLIRLLALTGASQGSLIRLLSFAGASQVIVVPRLAQPEDPDWINKFIPLALNPAVANVVAVASGFEDVNSPIYVVNMVFH